MTFLVKGEVPALTTALFTLAGKTTLHSLASFGLLDHSGMTMPSFSTTKANTLSRIGVDEGSPVVSSLSTAFILSHLQYVVPCIPRSFLSVRLQVPVCHLGTCLL